MKILKTLKNLLLYASAITVLISALFYTFVSLDQSSVARLNFSSFALIFLISCIISASSLIFKIKNISSILRIIIHYAALLLSFLGVLAATEYFEGRPGSSVIVLAFVFTVIYALIFISAHFIGKAIFAKRKATSAGEPIKSSQKKKNDYKPRFKKED